MGFGGTGGSNGAIATSSDVSLSNPQTNHVLSYDGSTAKWENQPLDGKAVTATGGGKEVIQFQNSVSGAVTLDLANANVFDISLAGDVTLTFAGATANTACSFSLFVYAGGGASVVTWPTSVRWPNGVKPTLTGTGSAADLLVFMTYNGGTVWYGNLVGNSYA